MKNKAISKLSNDKVVDSERFGSSQFKAINIS